MADGYGTYGGDDKCVQRFSRNNCSDDTALKT
jgi:hypothetical protein